jgi:hypothetical protein
MACRLRCQITAGPSPIQAATAHRNPHPAPVHSGSNRH